MSMQPFLVRCFTTALSLGVVSWVLPGVTITSVPALLVGAVVLALVNTRHGSFLDLSCRHFGGQFWVQD